MRSICKDRPIPSHLRNEVWKICLNVNSQIDHLESFNDLFDLPNQDLLHDNCCEFVATLPKDLFSNSIGFISDIEIILTYFSRTYKINYEEDNGWLSILRILCCELKLTKRSDLYNYFSAICHRFLPSSSVLNGEIFSVFRLLLQYHDPELCSFLDTHRITPESYSFNWFTSIFSSHIPIEALVKLWDIYFLVADPFLMFYLALIVVLNLKESLLEMRGYDRPTILTKIQSALRSLSEDDVEDFHTLAQHYVSVTPKSFHCKFSPILFGNAHKDSEIQTLIDFLCMPISIHELLEAKSLDTSPQSIKYFLVDCRPADQYNAGHLPSAYFLDSSLILSSPGADFQTSMAALLSTQQQALEFHSDSAGEHICFLGSGNVEEDRIVNMVVAQFLQKMTKYVSLVFGGYRAIHDVLGPHCDQFFTGHDASQCQVCLLAPLERLQLPTDREHTMLVANDNSGNSNPGEQRQVVGKFLTRFSSAIKLNSSKFKDRLAAHYAERDKPPPAVAPTNEKRHHYSQNQSKHAKTYRNTGNIFSIDEDGDKDAQWEQQRSAGIDARGGVAGGEGELADASPEMINLALWMRKPDVIATYDCCVVDESRALQPGHLLLTETHLFVLKKSVSKLGQLLGRAQLVAQPLQQQQHMVSIHRRRVLSSVVKITSKRRYPECLTFHYLMPDGTTVEQDRYVIEKAGEAARLIKIQVQKMIDAEALCCG